MNLNEKILKKYDINSNHIDKILEKYLDREVDLVNHGCYVYCILKRKLNEAGYILKEIGELNNDNNIELLIESKIRDIIFYTRNGVTIINDGDLPDITREKFVRIILERFGL